jgi:hypothetical protein
MSLVRPSSINNSPQVVTVTVPLPESLQAGANSKATPKTKRGRTLGIGLILVMAIPHFEYENR